jgi:hypothetical protein
MSIDGRFHQRHTSSTKVFGQGLTIERIYTTVGGVPPLMTKVHMATS